MPDENALAEAQTAIESPADEKGSAPPAVTETAQPSEQATETNQERPSRAKERIQELAADKRAAIEFAELQRQRADELQRQLLAVQKPAAETKAQPKLADYATPEEWATANTAWTVEQAEKRAEARADKRLSDREIQAAEAQRQASFEASLRKAAEGKADYWDVVQDRSATWLHAGVIDVLKDFDSAGALAYHLAANPVVGREIAALPPRRMAAALGRLEITVSEKPKPTPPKPKVTEAPEPPTPVGGGSAVTVDYSKLANDTNAYIKQRRADRRAARERR
jgi:hypothetical protein